MTHVTCRLTAKNRDRLRNPTLGNRVWATFTLFTLRSVGCEVVLCARACVRAVCMCVCIGRLSSSAATCGFAMTALSLVSSARTVSRRTLLNTEASRENLIAVGA